tara:strand:- start:16 stop:462 length:447 start_codon:yes stop_codon:yes gene_type:complete
LKAEFKKIKNQIDFKDNIKKTIDKVIFLSAQINVKDIKSGLDTSKGPRGPIAKVKLSTAKQKVKKGYPIKPLVATGMMRKLPPVKPTKNGKTQVRVANKRAKIAQWHDQGGDVKGRPPKRPWFDIYPQTIRKIERLLKKELVKLYKRL